MYLSDQLTFNHSQGPFYEQETSFCAEPNTTGLKLIAYYLPQFHRIAENDENWGKGFTEWSNVVKAIPRFEGHYQPHLPADLGLYDLSRTDVIEEQASLARKYGIHGFCFHYYWFNGKKLLDLPLENLLSSTTDINFCINWANENWTRNWDGGNREVLQAQDYKDGDQYRFVDDLCRIIEDRRYIKINGRPLILVYKSSMIPNVKDIVQAWRSRFVEKGFGNPFLVMCAVNECDPRPFGFDAAAAFPPHIFGWYGAKVTSEVNKYDPTYSGTLLRYDDMVEKSSNFPEQDFKFFHGLCPSWDNEARQPGRGFGFVGSNPRSYGRWLANVCGRTLVEHEQTERLIFVNAWNEWAEGAHLEPDRHHGHAFLRETARVLNSFQRRQNESVECGHGTEEILSIYCVGYQGDEKSELTLQSIKMQKNTGFRAYVLYDEKLRAASQSDPVSAENIAFLPCPHSHVYHQVQYAISHANSAYVCFIICGNYLVPNFTEAYLKIIKVDSPDLVLCSIIHAFESPGGRKQLAYNVFHPEPKVGGVDLSSFVARTSLIKSVDVNINSNFADGLMVENLMKLRGESARWREIQQVLVVRN
ncbi:glycosyltransferase WbsX family protein [Methylobacterium phyllosphaerae]